MTKKMSDAEQREHLEKKYRELDANNDGGVSLKEFIKDTQGFAKVIRQHVWEYFNANQDDGLSLDEYLDTQGAKP